LCCAGLSCGGPERERRHRVRAVDDAAASDDPAPPPVASKAIDPRRSMRVHLLDVGQGAATLVEFPCGALLVDTGAEVNASFDGVKALERQLDAFFARRADLQRTLDLVVITHPHIDHLRGLPMVLDRFTVKNLVDDGLPGEANVQEQMQAIRAAVTAQHIGYRGVKASDIVKKNGLSDDVIDPFACADVDPRVRVLAGAADEDPGWGSDNYGHMQFEDMNNHSVVVRVDVGNGSLLITGDLEEVAIRGLLKRYRDTRWLDVDVLQVGHHGSANGTTRELLVAATPQVALIAAGPSSRHEDWSAWSYGHPRVGVIELLEEEVALPRSPVPVTVAKGMKRFENRIVDKAIYVSGWDGPVTVDLDANGTIQVEH
jgi:competence protein ComEC